MDKIKAVFFAGVFVAIIYILNSIKNIKKFSIVTIVLIIMEEVMPLTIWACIILEMIGRLPGECDRLVDLYKCLQLNTIHIMDGFYIIWGMILTIVLFLIESCNICWYGIRFRKIIKMSIDEKALWIGAGEYMLLCPVVCATEMREMQLTCLLCIVWSFIAFLAITFYIVYKTRPKNVRKLIRKESIERFKDIVEDEDTKYMQMKLGKLLAVSMIMNTDYDDSEDIDELIAVLREIFDAIKKEDVRKSAVIKRVIIMNWVDWIVDRSGVGTKHQRERTTYILRMLWGKIKPENKAQEKAEDVEEQIELALGLLLPLFQREVEATNQIFISVWIETREMGFSLILYLLLYAEFQHIDYLKKFPKKYSEIVETIGFDRAEFKRQCSMWNSQLAWRFWMSWAMYKDGSNNLGLSSFEKFRMDINSIARSSIPVLQTYTMQEAWKGVK